MAVKQSLNTLTGKPHLKTPFTARLAVIVLWFLGLTAVGGGIAMALGLGMGDGSWLEDIPLVPHRLLPAAVLILIFGAGSLLTAYGIARMPSWKWVRGVERLTGRHWSWVGTLGLGVGMMLWVALQLIWLDLNALHTVYGTVGVVLVSVGLSATFRSHLQLGDPSN
jgi:hypothetical protein